MVSGAGRRRRAPRWHRAVWLLVGASWLLAQQASGEPAATSCSEQAGVALSDERQLLEPLTAPAAGEPFGDPWHPVSIPWARLVVHSAEPARIRVNGRDAGPTLPEESGDCWARDLLTRPSALGW